MLGALNSDKKCVSKPLAVERRKPRLIRIPLVFMLRQATLPVSRCWIATRAYATAIQAHLDQIYTNISPRVTTNLLNRPEELGRNLFLQQQASQYQMELTRIDTLT
jgi:hypothetical protein